MDMQALWEALSAVLVTPVASLAMALIVFAGILLLVRRAYRR